MAHIYGKRYDGKVFEIQNWGHDCTRDALVMQPLSNTQTRTLHRMRAKGCSDSQIWSHLHPGKPRPDRPLRSATRAPEFRLQVADLDKSQLIWLIQNTMQLTVESLEKVSRADLIKLATHMGGGPQIRVSFSA